MNETTSPISQTMEVYMGTKTIKASGEITKAQYCAYRGWPMPEDEDPNELGRVVEYPQPEGKKGNHHMHEGYISWSPKFAFDAAYRSNGNLTFGHAVELLKMGFRVNRDGWNGKGMFLFKQVPANIGQDIIPRMQSVPQKAKDEMIARGQNLNYRNQCVIVDIDGNVDNWSPSISDVFAEDWRILD